MPVQFPPIINRKRRTTISTLLDTLNDKKKDLPRTLSQDSGRTFSSFVHNWLNPPTMTPKDYRTIQACVQDGLFDRITDVDLDQLESAHISSLCYSAMFFHAEDMKKLSKILSKLPKLIELSLQSCGHSEDSMRILINSLKNMEHLQRLVISKNELITTQAARLSAALRMPMLQHLDLSNNQIGPEGTRHLCQALSKHTGIRVLDISGNSITASGAKYIANMLRRHRTLQKLYVGSNELYALGVGRIAESLKINSVLTHLNLDLNESGPEGARALAEAFKVNTSLTHLQLSRNNLHDAGAMFLAEALMVPGNSLKWLDVEFNNIGQFGALALAHVLAASAVAISRINFAKKTEIILQRSFRLSRQPTAVNYVEEKAGLVGLNLALNFIGDEGATSLAFALKKNPALRHLNLNGNGLSQGISGPFADALAQNNILQSLNLCGNNCDQRCIVDAIKSSNLTLRGLRMDYDYQGWEQVHDLLQKTLARNCSISKSNTAVYLLRTGRWLLNPNSWSGCRLPLEIKECIWAFLNPVLSKNELIYIKDCIRCRVFMTKQEFLWESVGYKSKQAAKTWVVEKPDCLCEVTYC